MASFMQEYYDKYKNHSLKQFWDWWSRKDAGQVMEVRILKGLIIPDYSYLKDFAYSNKLVFNGSSFFVSSYDQLLCIMREKNIRDKYNIYYGLNPRKECSKIYGDKIYSGYGGKNVNVKSIRFIGFDMESILREDVASPDQLLNAEKLADFMIRYLGENFGWNDYVKVCSGNGFHLIYQLEKDVELPELKSEKVKVTDGKNVMHHKETKKFIGLKKAVNKIIDDVKAKLDGKFTCKIDSCGDLARILRMPMSKNCKPNYTEHRYCGIVSFGDGKPNSKMSKSVSMKVKKLFDEIKVKKDLKQYPLNPSHVYTPENIKKSAIAQLLLLKMHPQGDRNHYLELQFALLLRDNNIHPDQIQELILEINATQGKSVQVDPTYLAEDAMFNPNIINLWCMKNLMQPVYPLYKKDNSKQIMAVEWVEGDIDDIKDYDKNNIMKAIKQLTDDINIIDENGKKKSYPTKKDDIERFIMFMNKNYGVKTSKYYCFIPKKDKDGQILSKLLSVL